MDPRTQATLLLLVGAAIGAAIVAVWLVREQRSRQQTEPPPALPSGVASVLSVLPSSALVVDEHDIVLKASAPAYALGLVRGGELCVPELAEMVRQVRRDGQIREAELVVPQATGDRFVSARVAPLGSKLVLTLADDRTREHRVEAVRRDFVANVSHELKTPVGAITMLAEAVAEASDDPEAVERFAGRMCAEAERLSRLVQQIIELSRLQGDDPLETPEKVSADDVVEAAVEQSSTSADAKQIIVTHEGRRGLHLLGHPGQLTLALGNLVANAVAYSPEGSRVAVEARAEGDRVDLVVTDHGVGIPAEELDRIFERFYRLDPARHRSTGGNGLGLSIVKHVAASHGGDVRVRSVEGKGSAFTLRLPQRVGGGAEETPVRRPGAPAEEAAVRRPGAPAHDDPAPAVPLVEPEAGA